MYVVSLPLEDFAKSASFARCVISPPPPNGRTVELPQNTTIADKHLQNHHAHHTTGAAWLPNTNTNTRTMKEKWIDQA